MSSELAVDRLVSAHWSILIAAMCWFVYRFNKIRVIDPFAVTLIWLTSTMYLFAEKLSIAPMVEQSRCDNLVFSTFMLLTNYPVSLHLRWWQAYAHERHEAKRSWTIADTAPYAQQPSWMARLERLFNNTWFYLGLWAVFTAISLMVDSFSVVPHAGQGCFADSPSCFFDVGINLSISALILSLLSAGLVVSLLSRLPSVNRYLIIEVAITSTAQGVFFGSAIGQYSAAYETCSVGAMESARLLLCLYALFTTFHLILPALFIDSDRIIAFIYRKGHTLLSNDDEPDDNDRKGGVADTARMDRLVQAMREMAGQEDFQPVLRVSELDQSYETIIGEIAGVERLRWILNKYGLGFLLPAYGRILDFAAVSLELHPDERRDRATDVIKSLRQKMHTHINAFQIPVSVESDTNVLITRGENTNPLLKVQSFVENVFRVILEIESGSSV
jgi:hypothetical protein